MKKMKKLIALLIACVFVIGSLAACGGSGGGGAATQAAGGEAAAPAETQAAGEAAAPAAAGDKTEIVVGYASSFTGPLGEFTQAYDWDSALCLDKINADGGIYIEAYGKKLPIRVVKADTESTAATATEVAKKLINQDKVDVLIGAWTPENTSPIAAVAEQFGVPCICSNSPYESWTATYQPNWAYGLMFSATDIVTGYVSALKKIKDETNGMVGFLFDSDVDGVTFSGLVKPLLEDAGFTVYDPGRFSVDTTDFTSIIADLQSHDCDIVIGNQILPNFMTAWKQFNEKNYIPKAFVLGKGLCYGTDFMALDPLPDGIMCEIEFAKTFPYKSDFLGITAEDLANMWEEEKGTQFPVCSFGYDVAQWEVLFAALENCKDLEPETIKNAIQAVDINSIYGHIVFTECDNHVAKCPIVCGQWFPSKEWENTYDFNIVGSGNWPEIADTDPYIIPNTTQD